MTVQLVRIDNRLIHGQIATAWVPLLGIDLILVGEAEVKADPLESALLRSAAPTEVAVEICAPAEVADRLAALSDRQVLVLFRTVGDAVLAWNLGFRFARLNLGNCHAGPGRRQVSKTVFLQPEEIEQLTPLAQAGVEVFCQALPAENVVGVCPPEGER